MHHDSCTACSYLQHHGNLRAVSAEDLAARVWREQGVAADEPVCFAQFVNAYPWLSTELDAFQTTSTVPGPSNTGALTPSKLTPGKRGSGAAGGAGQANSSKSPPKAASGAAGGFHGAKRVKLDTGASGSGGQDVPKGTLNNRAAAIELE